MLLHLISTWWLTTTSEYSCGHIFFYGTWPLQSNNPFFYIIASIIEIHENLESDFVMMGFTLE